MGIYGYFMDVIRTVNTELINNVCHTLTESNRITTITINIIDFNHNNFIII